MNETTDQPEASGTEREPVKCALPRCQVTFVPKSRDHKYCSATCKKRGFRYRFALNLQQGRGGT